MGLDFVDKYIRFLYCKEKDILKEKPKDKFAPNQAWSGSNYMHKFLDLVLLY